MHFTPLLLLIVIEFLSPLRKMTIDPKSRCLINLYLENEDSQKSISNAARLIPGSVALCHTPLFVLNPAIDLSQLDFACRDLSLSKVINVCVISPLLSCFDQGSAPRVHSTPPPALNERTLLGEQRLWRRISILLVKLFSEFNGNTACPILPSDLHLALTEDFSNIGERSTKAIPYEKVDWPYMTHLPERIPLVGLILFDFPPLTQVQDAEPAPGNDNGANQRQVSQDTHTPNGDTLGVHNSSDHGPLDNDGLRRSTRLGVLNTSSSSSGARGGTDCRPGRLMPF